MSDPFARRRDLGGASIIYENSSPRWHPPERLDERLHPSWREIRRQMPDEPEDVVPESQQVEPPATEIAFSEADVARMCARAAADARQNALEIQHNLNQARLASLAGDFTRSLAGAEQARNELLDHARGQLALVLKTAIDAIEADEATRPRDEDVVRFVRQCVARLDHPDEVRVEVAPDIAGVVEQGIEGMRRELSLETRILVRPSAAFEPGQVRVSWRDGWAESDPGQVERVVREHLAILIGEGTRVAGEEAGCADGSDKATFSPDGSSAPEVPGEVDEEEP
ncbi:MAG: hypothetical protein R3D03_06685 [Geminicoccaceae bacterium]